MEKLFAHNTVDLSHNLEQNYLHLKWQGVVEIDIYKQVLRLCLDYIESYQIHHFLVDQTQLEYVGSEAQAWLSVYWFPEAEKIAQGNLYFAIISSKKLFVSLASKVVAARLKASKRMSYTHYFDNEPDAINWLLNPTIEDNLDASIEKDND